MDNYNVFKMNPFKYGSVVSDPYFIDRENEVEDLSRSIKGGANIILYSPRRYGKTSLIKRVGEKVREDGMTVLYLDLFKVNSREQFLSLYYQTVLEGIAGWEKSLKTISSFLKSVRPLITMNQDGTPSVWLDIPPQNKTQSFSEIVNLPEKLAGKQRWVIIIDEFQEIENFGGESFEKELRAVIQHHQHVSYILMGSRKHLLLGMVTRKNRAFYNFGKLVYLDKIPAEYWRIHLKKSFDQQMLPCKDEIIESLIQTAENIPYYVQYLAFELLECSVYSGSPDDSTLQMAISRIMVNQQDYFQTLWESLSTTQQKTLKGLVVHDKFVFSKEFLNQHKIHTTSGVQRSIEVLMRRGIIDKQNEIFNFEDPFLKKWLLTR